MSKRHYTRPRLRLIYAGQPMLGNLSHDKGNTETGDDTDVPSIGTDTDLTPDAKFHHYQAWEDYYDDETW